MQQDPAKALGLSELSDDYRAPPPTRWAQPWSLSWVTILTALGALLVGFLLTAGASVARSAAEAQDVRKEQLIALIEERQERVDDLNDSLESLRAQVAVLEEGAGAPALHRELTRIEQLAGLTGAQGPGLRLVLDDAPGECPSGQAQDCQIQDTDLQLAVNTLFDAGAESIAINGERIISTTAIRSAGRAVLVNYRVLSPPYELAAVGDPETLATRFEDSAFAFDFAVWEDTYGLGFEYEPVDELVLPAFVGSVRVQHAAPVEGEETR